MNGALDLVRLDSRYMNAGAFLSCKAKKEGDLVSELIIVIMSSLFSFTRLCLCLTTVFCYGHRVNLVSTHDVLEKMSHVHASEPTGSVGEQFDDWFDFEVAEDFPGTARNTCGQLS